MTDKEIVKGKFCVSYIHKRLTDRVYEVRADGSMYAQVLGEGITEQEAWSEAAKVVIWWRVDRREEIMNGLIKQLTGVNR